MPSLETIHRFLDQPTIAFVGASRDPKAFATTGLRRGLPIAEAATLAGFADQSHFTRHFKRIWRTTPGTYARAGRENDRGARDQKRNWPPLEITASST